MIAAVCVACRCPRLWWDVSGGGPHCAGCKPPPALGLVARTREVITLPGGSLAWSDEMPQAEMSEADLDEAFDQRYRRYVTRDGKRDVIERLDWKAIDSAMIVRRSLPTDDAERAEIEVVELAE